MSNSIKNFLEKEMCIDLEHFYEKLSSESINPYQQELIDAIKEFHLFLQCPNAEELINNKYCDLNLLCECEMVHEVFDSIRHVFVSFAYNGLHQLFTRQENEVWYPRVILKAELMPNDIESLPNNIVLYRGTDKKEFETNNYGQSWSTKLNVANDFAYQHYVAQPWFNEEERIVLKAEICKSAVFFSDQSCEYEVVVDTKFLSNVQVVHITKLP